MSDALCTQEALDLFGKLRPSIRCALAAFNDQCFPDGQEVLCGLKSQIELVRDKSASASDDYLNNLWVVDRYLDFISKYGLTWESIVNQHFSDSWCSLQDALDLLRLVKRFSRLDISFFEDQVIELERAYPYNVFFSIGATVEYFECSLCGKNIDSQECPHIQGQLYRGAMANAIVRNFVQLDHVAMVAHPRDKRCVVSYEDDGKQFQLVRHLSSLIANRQCRILDFGHLKFSKRFRPNPDYRKLRRNEQCYCGSGKKFKYCCIAMSHVESDHVDIIANRYGIDHVAV
ncbi:MAG: SEC-C domain-containing protein [Rhodocyclales bacterium]|nr:SEC-C domain-containing protein [Rhodocyclales bacterium]